jgi:hypothetical protein
MLIKISYQYSDSSTTIVLIEHPVLALCPVTFFLTTALALGAFHPASGIKTIRDIDRLRVPSGRRELELQWSDEFKKRPVFPGFKQESSMWQPNKDPIPQDRIRIYMKRVCHAARWNLENGATPYIIRRGIGTALNCKCPGLIC